MDWKPYLKNRLVAEHPAGFFVIIPENSDPPVALSCPVCDRLLRSRDDETSYAEYACCHLCALQWAHARKVEWKSGWRPPSEDVATVVSSRPPLSVVFDTD